MVSEHLEIEVKSRRMSYKAVVSLCKLKLSN